MDLPLVHLCFWPAVTGSPSATWTLSYYKQLVCGYSWPSPLLSGALPLTCSATCQIPDICQTVLLPWCFQPMIHYCFQCTSWKNWHLTNLPSACPLCAILGNSLGFLLLASFLALSREDSTAAVQNFYGPNCNSSWHYWPLSLLLLRLSDSKCPKSVTNNGTPEESRLLPLLPEAPGAVLA